MKNKKLAIVGKGTAGSMAISYFSHFLREKGEIELYYDPNSPEQAVGEGTDLTFPKFLSDNLSLNSEDLKNVLEGTYKRGIRKIDYQGSGDFMHTFPIGSSGIHFNATKFQELIFNKFKSQIKFSPTNLKSNLDIDATHIIDCSGRPNDYTEYHQSKNIPVNSSHIVQCYWEFPKFDYTLTIARPYGWVFLIPLQNRCSVGYLYNNTINNLEEIKTDIQTIFQKYNLIPSNKINSFSFNNYYKKENFTDRVSYNGNASFFLEPLEATSITNILKNIRYTSLLITGKVTKEELNKVYLENLEETEQMIMMHYFAGSKYNTPFWQYAYEKSLPCMNKMTSNLKFKKIIKEGLYNLNNPNLQPQIYEPEFSTWQSPSFIQNISNLGILKNIINLMDKHPQKTKFI